MAEEADKKEGGDEAASADGGKSKKKLFIIIGGGVTLLIVVIVALVLLLGGKKGDKEDHSTESLAADAAAAHGSEGVTIEGFDDEDELEEGEEPLGAIYPFDALVLNLKGGGYARCQIQIEFVDQDVPARFLSRLVPIRDALISLITSKESKELLSERGKADLKKEVREKINTILKKEEVKNVYFTQFVVQ